MTNELKKDPAQEKPSRFSPSARHYARQYALQALYQWQIAKTSINAIEIEFSKRYEKQKFDRTYFQQLLHNIPANQPEIDQIIAPFLKRSIEDVDLIEQAVLRLATYELMKCPDIPYRVIINEALELTKQYGSGEGYKFVNGILDQIART